MSKVTNELSRAGRAIGSAVRAGTSYLSELLQQLVSKIGGLALIAGCSSGDAATAEPTLVPPIAEVAKAPVIAPTPPPAEPEVVGDFNITFYYMIGEDEVVAKKPKQAAPANDNVVAMTDPQATDGSADLAAIAPPPEQVTLYSGTCEPIADVTKEFGAQLALQGTGKLRDGRVLNVWGACSCPRSPCFKTVEQTWGTAGSGRALQPFRTVAVDPKLIKLGTMLYIPILDGKTMPGRSPWGGFVHDGCVVADDVGGGIKGNQLDLFVGRKGWFLGMSGHGSSHAWAKHVPVYNGAKRCERRGRQVARKAGAI